MKNLRRKVWMLMAALVLGLVVAGGITTQASAATKPTKITLNKTTMSIKAGAQKVLKVKSVTPKSASTSVTWTSSNTSVAKVSSKGVVTGKSAGTATITATSKKNSKVKATCKVYVYAWKTVSASSSGLYKINGNNSTYIRVKANKRTYTFKTTSLRSDVESLFNAFYSGKSTTITFKCASGGSTYLKINKSKKTATFSIRGTEYSFTYTTKNVGTSKVRTTLVSENGVKYLLVSTSTSSRLYYGTKALSANLIARVSTTSNGMVTLFCQNTPNVTLSSVSAFSYKK